MRRAKDAKQHFEQHMDRAAEKYVRGLQKAGLQPNPTLTRAVAEHAWKEAEEQYVQEVTDTCEQNVQYHMNEHKKRLDEIKRDGARFRLIMCPPIALLFALMAWYSLSQPGGFALGIGYSLGALAFVGMLLLGAVFDRPQ